ncbi:MAG TPA: AEC family transporter [Anaerolineaceae bacterium]|nr:AEC family transporter [Anaerolineaceae bacterium]HPS33520.1 AEC family transporter [Anaerolineaceae bacterium]
MILQGAFIVIQQIFIIFILIGVGFLAAKFGILGEEGARQLTDLLLLIVIPCVIIMAFQASFERSLIKNLLIAALLAALTHTAGILLSKLIFKNEAPDRKMMLAYSTVFYNAGFFSLPLLRALLGETGVLYGSVFVAVFNLFAWTYGVRMMNGGNSGSKWKTFWNPGVISLLIALMLVLFNIRLPEILQTTLRYITGLHTPLAMMIIGCQFYMMRRSFNLRDLGLWKTVLARNILVPLLMLALIFYLAQDKTLFFASVITASAPTATNTILFATKYRQDVNTAVQTVILTTLITILSIPLMMALAMLLKGAL